MGRAGGRHSKGKAGRACPAQALHGYAIFDPEHLTPQEAIEEADQMMYRVKQSRKKAEQAK